MFSWVVSSHYHGYVMVIGWVVTYSAEEIKKSAPDSTVNQIALLSLHCCVELH